MNIFGNLHCDIHIFFGRDKFPFFYRQQQNEFFKNPFLGTRCAFHAFMKRTKTM